MVKEVFLAHMLWGRGGGFFLTELCVAPSDFHTSRPGNGRKNNQVGVIFTSVNSFLLSVFLFPLHWCHSVQQCHL